jgi:hypothetical protein
MSQTDKLLTEISEKMDKMLRLLAIDTVKGVEKEQDKIELLDSLGFRPVEIAKFLNKSQDNINVQLSIIRKKKEAATKPKATEQTQPPEGSEKGVTGVITPNSSKPEGDQK